MDFLTTEDETLVPAFMSTFALKTKHSSKHKSAYITNRSTQVTKAGRSGGTMGKERNW
jgi:hypothetical protein